MVASFSSFEGSAEIAIAGVVAHWNAVLRRFAFAVRLARDQATILWQEARKRDARIRVGTQRPAGWTVRAIWRETVVRANTGIAGGDVGAVGIRCVGVHGVGVTRSIHRSCIQILRAVDAHVGHGHGIGGCTIRRNIGRGVSLWRDWVGAIATRQQKTCHTT